MKSSEIERMISEIEVFLRHDTKADKPRAKGSPSWLKPALYIAAVLAVAASATAIYMHQDPSPADGVDLASTAAAGPGYTFLRTNRSGTPVRWNPCAPIYYVTNFSSAPSWAAGDLEQAMQKVTAQTGLQFVSEGTTADLALEGPVLSPGGQSPVEIVWAGAAESVSVKARLGPELQLLPARAEPVIAEDEITGHGVYVTGSIIVENSAVSMPPGFAAGGLGNLWLHELGQLVGLGDTPATGEIMNPGALASASGFGTGDLAGLRRLGSVSGCLKVPNAPNYEPAL